MDPINTMTMTTPSTATVARNSFAELSGGDFFQLLLTQITNQDPLEPIGNQELLNQIASIRDIELSTALTSSLETLTGQQRFTSASALIGQYVTGITQADGSLAGGLVVGVRFDAGGQALLQLSDGTELPLEQVSTVTAPQQAAQMLIGLEVTGVDRRDPSDPQTREGVVTGFRTGDDGRILLELDTGEDLRLGDVISAAEPAL